MRDLFRVLQVHMCSNHDPLGRVGAQLESQFFTQKYKMRIFKISFLQNQWKHPQMVQYYFLKLLFMERKWGHNAILFTQKNIEENHYLYRGLNVKTCAKKKYKTETKLRKKNLQLIIQMILYLIYFSCLNKSYISLLFLLK